MKSRQRVLTALNHQAKDRVPIDFDSFPGATSMQDEVRRKIEVLRDGGDNSVRPLPSPDVRRLATHPAV